MSGCSTLLETALASPDLATSSEDSPAPGTLVTVAPRPPPRTVLALQTSAAMAAGDRVKWVNKAAQVQANTFGFSSNYFLGFLVNIFCSY